MYIQHMPLIRDHGLASHEGFADVVTFALLSIRQPFLIIGKQMADIRANGDASKYLWGFKFDGYSVVHGIMGQDSWLYISNTDFHYKATTHDAMYNLVRAIPGLGIVKAGFVLQMLGRNVGCIDSRNMHRLKQKNKRLFRFDADYSDKYLHNTIDDYIDLCISLGGAEVLWNDWCIDLARESGNSPDYISALHLAAIKDQS